MKNQLYQNNGNDVTLAPEPFFSIIIATYNRTHLLKRALNSLIAQTEEDWEAIIIDDGSTEDTYSEITPYLRRYLKIKYFKKAHSGEASSKNAGIWLSRGKFISFLDSDDEYNPKHLEYRKTILMQNPAINFLHGGVQIIGNQFVPDRFNPEKKINLNNCVIGGTFFIERNTLATLNGFRNIYLGTDADLFDRAKKARFVMMEAKLPTYIYHHEVQDSITNQLYFNMQAIKEYENSPAKR